MSVNVFLTLFVILSGVSTLLTEAIKKATKEKFADNLIALIVSLIAGGVGTCMAYIWMGIPFTVPNILAAICMVVATWVGCQIGFDKVKQLIEQIKNGKE